jgi:hypothetical protein
MRLPVRKGGLLWEFVGDEAVVLDPARQRAHRLNRSAAVVWRNCDGSRSVPLIAAAAQRELSLDEPADELVSFVLSQLTGLGLVVDAEPAPETVAAAPVVGTTRRALVRKAAAALAALPIVATMAVPQPAKARSTRGNWRYRFRQP